MSATNPVVEGWLHIATEKLAPVTKARIGLEISAHFEEARERHRAEGLDEAESLLRALKDLGDPDAAARRFRRKYITESDLTLLKTELHPVIFLIRGVGASVGILIFSLPVFAPPRFRTECLIAAMFCLGLTLLRRRILPSRRKPGGSAAAVLLISILTECALVVVIYATMWGSKIPMAPLAPVAFLYLIKTWRRLRLLLKLRKVRDVWHEMPPLVKN